jgi:hypothetical protein
MRFSTGRTIRHQKMGEIKCLRVRTLPHAKLSSRVPGGS